MTGLNMADSMNSLQHSNDIDDFLPEKRVLFRNYPGDNLPVSQRMSGSQLTHISRVLAMEKRDGIHIQNWIFPTQTTEKGHYR